MANESYGSIIHNGVNYSLGGGANSVKKLDLTDIILTGTTNTSGGTITAGTWFYLNSKLVKAKVDIASNATFTLNTNYEKKTIGAELAELNSKISSPTLLYNRNGFFDACGISYTQQNDGSIMFNDAIKGVNVPEGHYLVVSVIRTTGTNVRITGCRNGAVVQYGTMFLKGSNEYVTYYDYYYEIIDNLLWDYASGGSSRVYDLKVFKL